MSIYSIIKIKDVVDKTGEALSSHILFIHAWSGCDTTSTFGQGQATLLKKIKESADIKFDEWPKCSENFQTKSWILCNGVGNLTEKYWCPSWLIWILLQTKVRKCKLSTRNPCGTNVCSCRKNGLKCVHVETVEEKPAIILNRP